MPEEHSERVFLSTLILLGIMGIAVIIYATPLGLGLREDSFSYITAAESFSSGTSLGRWAADGSFRPLTHFPPLLSLILAGFNSLYKEILPAFKYLNAGLFGSLIIITGFALHKLTGSKTFALLSAGLVAGSRVLIEQFSWAHSEPLYLVLGLIGLVTLSSYLQHFSRWGLLLVSSIAISLAFLTRYAGISLVVASITVIVFIWNADLKVRIKTATIFGIVTLLPTTFFVARNSIVYGGVIDRPVPSLHLPDYSTWMAGAKTILGWTVPYRFFDYLSENWVLFSGVIATTTFAIATVAYLVSHYKERSNVDGIAHTLRPLLISAFVCSAAVILITIFYLDRLTPLNDRILSPLYLIGLLIIVDMGHSIWVKIKPQSFKLILTAVFAILLIFHTYRGIQQIMSIRENGLGLTTKSWITSPTMSYIRNLPNVPIYTNDIPAVYFYTNRKSSYIPVQVNAATGETRADYLEQLETMHVSMRKKGAILTILGHNPKTRLNSSYLASLTQGLILVEQFQDGLVYKVKP